MESSYSGSSRRARTPAIGSSVPSCMVDKCTADLGQCRDYHRRHKVCELHSKTSKVFIKGQEQRFCQQCSSFHSLVEFDDGKRSCRKRLEGHNRRRRKPRRDSVSANAPRLFTSSQGTRYIHFGASQFLSGPVISQPLIGIAKSKDHTGGYDGPHSNGLNRVVDYNHALSLLSSPPHMVQPGLNPEARSLISSLKETQPVLVSNSMKAANLHGQDTFHVLPDGTSASGSQPTLSFPWE